MSLPQFFKKTILIFGINLFFVFSFCFAQNKFKLTVSPFILEEKVFPGQKIEREIFLTNESDEKLNLSILIGDIQLDEKGNLFIFSTQTLRFSLKDWLEIPEKEIEIMPKSSKKIKILFKIPEKEAVGSRQGVILFVPKREADQILGEGIFARISPEVGVLVFLYSSERAREELKILNFFSDRKSYFSPFSVKFTIELENSGNVYLTPMGKIIIENWQRKKVKEIPFNSQGFKILPESKRVFEEYFRGNFGFGKYQATLITIFGTPKTQGGEGTKTISKKTYFWIFPQKEIIFLFFIFLCLIFIFLFRKILRRKP